MDILKVYNELEKEHPGIKDWEAESIAHEYGPEAVDIVSTIINCATTLGPWESWRIFEKVAIVLNKRPVIGDIVQELEPREVVYAVHLLKKAFPERDFNDDVAQFISIWFKEGGLVVAHPIVKFIQSYLRLIKLTPEMEKIQGRYLEEINAYIEVMESSTTTIKSKAGEA